MAGSTGDTHAVQAYLQAGCCVRLLCRLRTRACAGTNLRTRLWLTSPNLSCIGWTDNSRCLVDETHLRARLAEQAQVAPAGGDRTEGATSSRTLCLLSLCECGRGGRQQGRSFVCNNLHVERTGALRGLPLCTPGGAGRCSVACWLQGVRVIQPRHNGISRLLSYRRAAKAASKQLTGQGEGPVGLGGPATPPN